MKSNNRSSHGFTILELITVIAVFSISASIATPTYKHVIDKFRLKGAVDTIFNKIQTARAEAIKINNNTYITFDTGGAWEMRLSSSLTCANDFSTCVTGDWKDSASASDFRDTSISGTTLASDSISFDFIRGTSNIGDITITLETYSVNIHINKLGHLKACSNNEATVSSMGYAAC